MTKAFFLVVHVFCWRHVRGPCISWPNSGICFTPLVWWLFNKYTKSGTSYHCVTDAIYKLLTGLSVFFDKTKKRWKIIHEMRGKKWNQTSFLMTFFTLNFFSSFFLGVPQAQRAPFAEKPSGKHSVSFLFYMFFS